MSSNCIGFAKLNIPKKDNCGKWFINIQGNGNEDILLASKYQPSRPYVKEIHELQKRRIEFYFDDELSAHKEAKFYYDYHCVDYPYENELCAAMIEEIRERSIATGDVIITATQIQKTDSKVMEFV